MLHSHYSFFF